MCTVSAADSKNADLLELDGAEERLSLCRADVLNAGSLRAAFSGCHGVFHFASPVSNDPISSLANTTAAKEKEAAEMDTPPLPLVVAGSRSPDADAAASRRWCSPPPTAAAPASPLAVARSRCPPARWPKGKKGRERREREGGGRRKVD
jgi:hypothetical protein